MTPRDGALDFFWLERDPSAPPNMVGRDGEVHPADVALEATPLGREYSAALHDGEAFATPRIWVGSESVLSLRAGYPARQSGRAVLLVEYGSIADVEWHELGRCCVGADPLPKHQSIQIELKSVQGIKRFRIRASQMEADECVLVFAFMIGAAEQASRINGLSNYAARYKAETGNFSSGQAYTHPMYGSENRQASTDQVELKTIDAAVRDAGPEGVILEAALRERLAAIEPVANEAPFNFAMRCLEAVIPVNPPNFFARMERKSMEKPLHILSLCSGAARIEEMLLGYCRQPASITLLDASEDLSRRAAQRLLGKPGAGKVDVRLGDINKGLPAGGCYDIIMCVSALHHVVELEKILLQINALLEDDGEFWSIGEQVGRNGNRLWPEAMHAANAAMQLLPDQYKRNVATGGIDFVVPDTDFSLTCFEGIRSEDLDRLLENYLIPVDVYKRNCFLWRLVDPTYCDNYSMASAEDVNLLRGLVIAEAMHWVNGGRGTELHGVYRKRKLVTS